MTDSKTTPTEPTGADPNGGTPPEPKTEPTTEPPAEGGNDEQLKAYGSALRKLLNLKEDDALDDLDTKINDYQSKAELALKRADERLIAAAINNLSGYDTKLLTKVMDMSKVSVDEKGEVVGLAEAVAEAAKEFPAVVAKANEKKTEPFHPVGAGSIDGLGKEKMSLQEAMKYKNEHPEANIKDLI